MHEAGLMAWPTIGLGLLGALVGLVGLGTAASGASRGVAVAVPASALVLATLCGASGLAGYLLGLRAVDDALVVVEPSMRAALEAVGRAEAAQNLVIAGVAALPAIGLGLLGLAIGVLRKPTAARR